eukprot:TRINITY_DN5650_c0_g1_i1.p1 TRINITY_DN5650_c0_g1~~TRINITY_DN5650_c0_g1_i1.p1  ORF type:complete len:263 (+),score=64.17 TRINITY_DN5650_c0_g1_i1:1-789(+)
MALASRIAIITGAASGMGLATATRLARGGARGVVLLDLPSSAGAERAAALAAQYPGTKVAFAPADVTSEAQVQQALDVCEQQAGGAPNIVVNCAGIATPGKVLGKSGPHSLDAFLRVLQINVAGTFNLVRLAAARMSAQPLLPSGERGVIINTASIAAYDGQIGQAAYASSKGAIVSMTLPLARELAANAIRVNTIAPGLVKTPLLAGLPEKAQQVLAASVPFPSRLAEPDEFASLVEHIVLNGYLNGEVIRLDGALRMPPK